MSNKVEKKSSLSIYLSKPVSLYYMLLGSSLALSFMGLIMVFSASSIHSLETKGNTYAIVLRQFIFFVISLPLGFLASRLSITHWQRLAKKSLMLALIALAVVQIPGVGKSVNGNHNWISLGFVDVQPSEIAKFLLILWAAYMLATRERSGVVQANVLLLIAPGFAAAMVLILLGNDLGTASVFAAILAGLLWVSGVPMRLFAFVTSIGFAGIATLIVTSPNRAQRFLVVLHPFATADYKNAGWQPAHSLLGLASGGLFGVGLGASRQKWGNLAEAHTDFIFSVIGEELGLVGTISVLLLFAALIFAIFKIAMRTHEPLVRYACSGIGCWMTIQVVLNIGSALSLLPVVGVTLPFLSYGGSALVSTYCGIGFVLGAARRDPRIYEELKRSKFPWLA
jgi:cell division protein FtsW